MKKKIISIITAILLIMTAVPTYSFAEQTDVTSESTLLTALEVSAPEETPVFYEEGENGKFYLRQASDNDTIWSENMTVGFSETVQKYFVLCNYSTNGQILVNFQVAEGVSAKYKVGDEAEKEITLSDGKGQFAIAAAEKGSEIDLIAQGNCKVTLTVSKGDVSKDYELNFYKKGKAAKIAGLKINGETPAGYDEITTTALTVGVEGNFSLYMGNYIGSTHKVTIYKDSEEGKVQCNEKSFTAKDRNWTIENILPGKYYIKYSNIQKNVVQYTHTLVLNAVDMTPHSVSFNITDSETNLKISDAQITVSDDDGKVYEASSGVYSLSPGGYTYTVKKQGYFTEQKTFVVEAQDMTVNVKLIKSESTEASNIIESLYGEHYYGSSFSTKMGEWKAELYEEGSDIYIADISTTSTSGASYTIKGTLASPTAMLSIVGVNGEKYPISYTVSNDKRCFETKVTFFAAGAQHFTVKVSDDGVQDKTYELIINLETAIAQVLDGLMLRTADNGGLLETSSQPVGINSDSSFIKKAVADVNRIVLQLKRNGSEPNFSLVWSLGTWFSNDENYIRVNGGE